MQNIYRVNILTSGASFRYMLDASTPHEAVKIAKEITEDRGANTKGAKITYEIVYEA